AAVAVAREHEAPAVGRPARAIALVPARVVGEPCDSTPIRVHDIDLFVAVAGADERDLLSVGRPGGRRSRAVMGQLGHAAPVYVHYVDIEVAVAVAMEGDPASEAFSGGQTELESVRLRGEGSFGVVTACEKSPNSEEWDQGGYHPPLRQPGRNSMAHIPSWVSAKKKPAVRVFAQDRKSVV